MKMLIWSSINDECVKHAPELSKYFKLDDLCIVDELNRPVIYFRDKFYYKSNDNFYPINNNRAWFGDYYDIYGNLVLTKDDKIRLLKTIPANEGVLSHSNNGNQYMIKQVLKLFADYATDYHRAIRPFETDNSYTLTTGNFNREYAEYYRMLRDDDSRIDAIINATNRLLLVEPRLFELLCEYSCSAELQYRMLSFIVDSGVLSMYSDGDWRISQWELMCKEKEEQELLKKLGQKAPSEEINEAIELYLKTNNNIRRQC